MNASSEFSVLSDSVLDAKASVAMSRIREMKTGRIQQRNQISAGVRRPSHNSKQFSPKPIETVYGDVSAEVALDLDMDHLDVVLRNIVKDFSSNRSLVKKARSLSYQVGAVKKPVGKQIGGVNLEDIAEILETAVSTIDDLPSAAVAYIHTYLGLIRQQENRYGGAIDSFVKALWIRRSARQPIELIAVASYRLGVAYALNGDNGNATAALKQAIQFYSKASISMDHEFVVAAQNYLFQLKKQHQGNGDGSDSFFKSKPFCSERDAETVTTKDSASYYSEGRRSRVSMNSSHM